MKFIDKLERKFGNRGIENLTIYIIVSYVLGYALMYINPGALSMLSLNVSEILHGQIWRLVTWIIYPPSSFIIQSVHRWNVHGDHSDLLYIFYLE